jgi:hypothetical protein
MRVLDLLFVLKDPEGRGDLAVLDHQGENLGAIVGALLGFDFGEEVDQRMRAGAPVSTPSVSQPPIPFGPRRRFCSTTSSCPWTG